jgi:hypothetical protein
MRGFKKKVRTEKATEKFMGVSFIADSHGAGILTCKIIYCNNLNIPPI